MHRDLVRLAHDKPELRPHLVPLLRKGANRRILDQKWGTFEMEDYIDALTDSFLLPYPAIWNSLGVKRNEVQVRSRSRSTQGTITFKTPEASIQVTVKPDGTHIVTGEARGAHLSEKFRYRPAYMPMHRGTRGEILRYIEDAMPAKVVFKVCGMSGPCETYDSVDKLTRKYRQTGTNRSRGMKVLQGLPHLKGLIGPMHEGREGDVVVVRYDTPELYDTMSR
jgi:hypothetical protein